MDNMDTNTQFECVASTYDNCYAIRNNETGEVRILKDCVCLDMEYFTEEDWDMLAEDNIVA